MALPPTAICTLHFFCTDFYFLFGNVPDMDDKTNFTLFSYFNDGSVLPRIFVLVKLKIVVKQILVLKEHNLGPSYVLCSASNLTELYCTCLHIFNLTLIHVLSWYLIHSANSHAVFPLQQQKVRN